MKSSSLLVLALLSFSLLGTQAGAQSGLTLGTVTSDGQRQNGCPTFSDGGTFFSGMTCYDGHEAGCPNTAEATPPATFTFVYGVATPAPPIVPIGTIVFLSGGKGTTPSFSSGEREHLCRGLPRCGLPGRAACLDFGLGRQRARCIGEEHRIRGVPPGQLHELGLQQSLSAHSEYQAVSGHVRTR
jgi:hypothetical protein